MGSNWDLFDEADEVVFLTKEEYRRLVKNYSQPPLSNRRSLWALG